MISSKFLDNVKSILKNKDNREKLLNDEKEKGYLTEYEKKIVDLLLGINKKIENFSYKDNPYKVFEEVDISEENLKKVLTVIDEVELKGKICDYLWCRFRNYESSKEAYNIYIELVSGKEIDSEVCFNYLIRIFSIFVGTGSKQDNLEALKKVIKKYIINNIYEDNFLALYLVEMFLSEKIKEYDFLEEIVLKKIQTLKKIKNSKTISMYYDLLEKIYCLRNNIPKNKQTANANIVNIRREKVKNNLDNARTSNTDCFLKVDFYKKAINILKLIPNTNNERIDIIKEMEPYQKEILKEIEPINYSIDGFDDIDIIIDNFKDKNFESILRVYVSKLEFFKLDELKKRVIKDIERDILGSFYPKAIVDKNGKIICKLDPILPEFNDSIIIVNAQNKYVEFVDIYTQSYIFPIAKYIKENINAIEVDIRKIVENNAFVPERRKESFIKGILAGFKFDFITSLSILLPQVENALRCFAEECGDVIYNNNEEGIEELKTFNAVLELPNLRESLDEDFLFNLKCTFTSKAGINMRNNIAHGVLDDEEFNSVYTIYTWWFILKIVCMYSFRI